MKLFPSVLRRKRGVVFFVAAFMLPLLFVVVVSIDTFSKRQTTTRNLLESNLCLSGRSALDQLEAQFIEIENGWLNAGSRRVDVVVNLNLAPIILLLRLIRFDSYIYRTK